MHASIAPSSSSSSSSPSPSRSKTPVPAAAAVVTTTSAASEDLFSIDLGDDEARGVSKKAAAGQNARDQEGLVDDVGADDDAADKADVSRAASPPPEPREAGASPSRQPQDDVGSAESAGVEAEKARGGEAASGERPSSLSSSMVPTTTTATTTSKTPDDASSSSSPLPPPFNLDHHDDAECCVCLDEFDPRDNPAARTVCGHRYHLQCVVSWAQRSSACPLCGARLGMEEPELDELLPPPRGELLRVTPLTSSAPSAAAGAMAAAFRGPAPLVMQVASSWDPSRRNSRFGGRGGNNSSSSSSSSSSSGGGGNRRGGGGHDDDASALSSPVSPSGNASSSSSPLPSHSPSPSSSSFRARWAALGAKVAAAVTGGGGGNSGGGATAAAASKAPLAAASLEQQRQRRHR